MDKKVVMFHPFVTDKMRSNVQDVLHSRFIGQGPVVDEFEKKFGEVLNIKYPVMVNSGTSALTLAYYLLGLQKGDEVITPVLTCTATNLPLLHMGVKIVFADIDRQTMNIDIKDVKSKMNKNTKAVVNVHLNGNLSPLGYMGIPVVGDYAQYHYQPTGFEDYVCYSFQAIKPITTGDGGLVAPNNKKDYIRAKKLRWFGIDREKRKASNWQLYLNREMTIDIDEAGWKYQATDIDAALGLGSLDSYKNIMNHHLKLSLMYRKGLRGIGGLTVIGGRWSFPVLVERRDDFCRMLLDHGVETNLVQLRNDIYTCFGKKRLDLPNMNYIESRYTHLPLHMMVTEEDVVNIINLIRKGW